MQEKLHIGEQISFIMNGKPVTPGESIEVTNKEEENKEKEEVKSEE